MSVIGVILELSLTFLQFFATIASIPDLEVPVEWENPLYYVKIVNLDIPIIRGIFPSLNDFRVYFTVVCVIVPLLLVFFGLFFLNSVGVLLWYLLLLTGFCLFFAGLLGSVLREDLDVQMSEDALGGMLVTGIVIFVAMLIVAGCYRGYEYRKKQQKLQEAGGNEDDIVEEKVADVMEQETKPFPILKTIFRVLMFIVFLVASLLFLQVFFSFQLGSGSSIASLQLGLGITFAVFAVIVLIWTIVGCIEKGRRFQWKFFQFMETQFMRLLLITMSILFVPVGAGLFVLFNCNEQTCPAGQMFIREGSWMPHNNTADSRGEVSVCIPCNAPTGGQICSASAELCTGESRQRLEADKFIDCSDLVIFNYAAVIVIIMYMIGVPVAFGNLVNIVTGLVLEKFPAKLPPDVDPEDPEAVWEFKVAQSDNSARFLYAPFMPVLRYTRLYQLIQKLVVVFTAVFVIRINGVDISPIWYALIAGLVIHLLSFIWLIVRRPFQHKFENGVAILMEFALTASMICALLLFMDYDVPPTAFLVIVILNGLLPIVAIVIGIALEWSSKKSQEEKEQEEQRKELEEEMQKRAQEDADAELAQQMHEAEQRQQPNIMAGAAYSPTDAPVHTPEDGQRSQTANTPVAMNDTFEQSGPVMMSTTKPMTREERVALQKQRAAQAREAVLERKKQAQMKLLEEQTDVDHAINVAVKRRLNLFLMAGGALNFVALGLCIVGLISGARTAPSRWDTGTVTVNDELAGYQSWEAFTENCCCVSNWGDPAKTDRKVVEQWQCANGEVRERLRAARIQNPLGLGGNIEVSGLGIRGECSDRFNPGCLLLIGGVDTTGGDQRTLVQCASTVNASAYALRWLW